jgi:hypothetical protein
MFDLPPSGSDFWVWMAWPIWVYTPQIESAIYSWFNVLEACA